MANIFSYDPHYAAMERRLRQAFGGNVCQLRGIAGNNRILFALRPAAGAPTRAQQLVQRVALCGALWPGLAPFNRLLAHWVVGRLRRSG